MRGDELRRRRRGRCLLVLDVAQHAGHILTDGDQHPLEQGEGFLLVFVDRRLLRIGAQVDELLKRNARRQMLLSHSEERRAGNEWDSKWNLQVGRDHNTKKKRKK